MRKVYTLLALFVAVLAATVALATPNSASATTCSGGVGSLNQWQLGYYRAHHVPVLGNHMSGNVNYYSHTVYNGIVNGYISVGNVDNPRNTWMQGGVEAGTDNVLHPYIEVFDNGVKVKQTVYSDVLQGGNQYNLTIDHFAGGDYHVIVPGGHTFTYGFNSAPNEQDELSEIQNPNNICNALNQQFGAVDWGSVCSCTAVSKVPNPPTPYIVTSYSSTFGFQVYGP
jgi:hypothetical protein